MKPYPFQCKFAESRELKRVIKLATGMGKTATVILGWIWKRKYNNETKENTPRRLVYCLPTRVLVEQTYNEVLRWLKNLGLYASNDVNIQHNGLSNKNGIQVTLLMGGENSFMWDLYPEKDSIIIGTQDMLLSRVINRGYAMSRYRWPIDFGLLNNDSLWVYDEIQLMGSGFFTGIQMHKFREEYGSFGPVDSIWMSATVDNEWIETVDFRECKDLKTLELSEEDLRIEKINKILNCKKKLSYKSIENTDEIASEVVEKHKDNTMSIIVLNKVESARKVYEKIEKLSKSKKIDTVLLHSHFRPVDRRKRVNEITSGKNSNMIVVSTQVIEAGVDISAYHLYSEICPVPSLVQRAGRCNRKGEYENAEITVFNFQGEKYENYPYIKEDIDQCDLILSKNYEYFKPKDFQISNPFKNKNLNVLRRKDIAELFDTESDLVGADTDVSRFIRDGKNNDVMVFWRKIPEDASINSKFQKSCNRASHDEICTVPIGDMKRIMKEYDKTVKNKKIFTFNWLDEQWDEVSKNNNIYPGQLFVMSEDFGKYDERVGWNINSKAPVLSSDINSSNQWSKTQSSWKSIREHSDEVLNTAARILSTIKIDTSYVDSIKRATMWHDVGKAHKAFQARIDKSGVPLNINVNEVAKAPDDKWINMYDKHIDKTKLRIPFRHELVSGILSLQCGEEDIVSYLAMSHHGKIRLAIRSKPGEGTHCSDRKRYALGVCDGDSIDSIEIGGNITTAKTTLDLSIMELGETAGKKSWFERIENLVESDKYGIFRLAYMESIVRAADQRASGGFI